MGARNSVAIPVRLTTAPSRLAVDAAAVRGPNIPCHGVIVKAICPGQTVYVGIANTVTAANGYPLYDGETLTFEVSNANQFWFIGSAAGQSVAFLPYTWV